MEDVSHFMEDNMDWYDLVVLVKQAGHNILYYI